MKQQRKTKRFNITPALLFPLAILAGYQNSANADPLYEAVVGGKAGVELRYRYETVDQTGISEKAAASTLRTRLNYATAGFNDFAAFMEFDNVTALGQVKYNDGTGLSSAKTSYPVVVDPEGTEVNQVNISYSGIDKTTLTLGRQRVVFDNARFIGNVGWRQNEQTYDGLTVVNRSLADTSIAYGYIRNVNRIFGGTSSKGDIDTKTHLLNIGYEGFDAGKITLYGYFLDLVDTPAASNKTLGARFAGGTKLNDSMKALYTAEFASQSDYEQGAATIDADYSLLELGAEVSGIVTKFGLETLGADGSAFSTPLATAHAFNGWADKFLNTPANGLVDSYVSIGGNLSGVDLTAVYHEYNADKVSARYGDELNLQAAKKFGKGYMAMAKYASYRADTWQTDTDKVWLMLQANFK
ncbi:MAG: alginate export family protein [Gammaproteobacteria bacterium]|nr:alginate export family protein [Gammaproteobacteria bacterium]